MLPQNWELLIFKKIKEHTRYSLEEEGNLFVIKAESKASASGLIRKIRIDPKQFPFIAWSWKATKIYNKGDVYRKEGDDYPARLYITFEYDPKRVSVFKKALYAAGKMLYGKYPPSGAITYIWGSNTPVGTTVPNPYTDRMIMIVVESGKTNLNTWVHKKRNILEDYRRAFGEDPPVISGVAIMTDSDDTGEFATTYYGDIVFHK